MATDEAPKSEVNGTAALATAPAAHVRPDKPDDAAYQARLAELDGQLNKIKKRQVSNDRQGPERLVNVVAPKSRYKYRLIAVGIPWSSLRPGLRPFKTHHHNINHH